MLKLYYTGAVKFDRPQNDAIGSLGGYISSTEIPNGLLNNMFGDLSKLTIQQGKSEIRVIAIKNVDSVNKTGLKCWFTYPNDGEVMPTDNNDCDFEIGFIAPDADNCGDLLTEKITNIYATPYTVTLLPNKITEVNALDLGTLEAGDYLCIFIRRKIKPSTQLPLPEADLLEILNGTKVLPKVEDIQLTFAWD